MPGILAAAIAALMFVAPSTPGGSGVAPQSPPPGTAFDLSAVQVVGNRRYTQADVIRTSGLQPGQSVIVADVNAAADRMSKTGLFKNVNYTYVTLGTRMTVTFEIVESDWTVPVVFDNFVWFTDDALKAALREEMPTFDGTSPAVQEAADRIGQVLQRMLAERRVEGRVNLVPLVDLAIGSQQYTFRIEPAPTLCALLADGEVAASDPDFVAALRSPIGREYSRSYLSGFSNGTLLNLYHRRGRWRATFSSASAVVSQSPGCAGVAVTLHVNEGAAYTWDKAEWVGNSAMVSAELDKLLQIGSGDVADVTKIDAALRRVHAAYGRQGYVLQSGTYAPNLDDSTRRAVFQFRIEEGAQFRMGAVEFAGVSEGDARSLQRRWRLKSGEVYDASYLDEFSASEIAPLRQQTMPPRAVDVEGRLDPQQRLVNVRIVFK